jgi:hypothetical protein
MMDASMPTGTPTSSTSTPSFQAEDQPVISVDTKKKELIGNYTNKGTEYRPEGQPRRTEVHDFENKELGKVVPYGVYDLADNSGWVSLGVTSGPWQRPPGGTLPSSRSTPSAPGSTTRVVSSIPRHPG